MNEGITQINRHELIQEIELIANDAEEQLMCVRPSIEDILYHMGYKELLSIYTKIKSNVALLDAS